MGAVLCPKRSNQYSQEYYVGSSGGGGGSSSDDYDGSRRYVTSPRGLGESATLGGGGGGGGGRVMMRAISDFQANCPGDLSFRRGDVLEVLRSDDEFWWQVRHFEDGTVGFVARHYLQTADAQQAASLDCWFDVDRLESERLLRMPGLEDGTYLLRPHRHDGGGRHPRQQQQQASNASGSSNNCTLSVRCAIVDANGIPGFVIRHYRVMPLENGSGFYISPNRIFKTLAELLQHFQAPERGDQQLYLSRPCQREFTPPPNFRDFEINRSHLELVEKVGQGSFGEVWRAKFGPVLEVAVKLMAQESVTVNNDFTAEARVMHGMQHSKIVQLIGVCTDTEPVYIVTEYMPLGSLHSFLFKDRKHREVTTRDMLSYLHQIAHGMEYLEQKSYIHCDLRAANILMANRQIVKVADFGLSKLVESGYYRRKSAFPLRWSAPECISRRIFTIKSDVWSFGVVIFEVVSRGEKPYKSWRNSDVEERVPKGQRMPIEMSDYNLEPSISARLAECMNNCWQKAPKQRPTFTRLKQLFENFAIEGEGGYVEIER